ncbi:MAG: Rieske 2Fe-2S domain-containing protein [Bacteriovoracaceae bacterium]|nr:Rieske 2Fe-2S domain-containing protein [Bacteriovoracaceae bacterium]
MSDEWVAIGKPQVLIRELESTGFLKELVIGEKKFVLTYVQGQFGVLNNKCNHMGAPLAKGKLKNGCVECPWHYWQFNHKTGIALSEASQPLATHGGSVPALETKIEGDLLFVNIKNESERIKAQYNLDYPGSVLAREPKREVGKIRVLGLSTTAMDKNHPRFSTSEELLKSSLARANHELDVETRFLALSELNFRNCEGFYSKSERACTWPCSITKMDAADEMIKVYENLVHWADVVIVSTPIRWGSASSLYYKMAERLNSIQNQITLKNRVLIQNKVAAFVITGGQDNIQAVAGQMLTFFGELGFSAPAFPFVAHSLGWSSEDMERNMNYVKESDYLHQHAFELVERSVVLVKKLLEVNK